MIFLFEKKRFAFLAIVLAALFLDIFEIFPIGSKIVDIIKLYRPILNTDTPTLTLENGGLKIEGNIPSQIHIENGIFCYFDSTFNDTVFKSSPKNSLFITPQSVYIQKEDSVKVIDLSNIQLDKPLEINPDRIASAIDSWLKIFLVVFFIIGVIVSLFLLLLISFFGAGFGTMIDAFKNGPFSFKNLFCFSSFFTLLMVIIWIIIGFSTFSQFKFYLLAHYLIFCGLVYLRINLSKNRIE